MYTLKSAFKSYAPFVSDEPQTALKLDYSSPLGDFKAVLSDISYSLFLSLNCWSPGLMDLFTCGWYAA